MRARLRRLLSAPTLMLVALVLLLGAWVGANAPGNGPDEPANYIKAIGAGTGSGLGREGRLPKAAFGTDPTAAFRVDWINANSRGFQLDAGLTPERFTCYNEAFLVEDPTTCTTRVPQSQRASEWISYVGTYPPFVFAVPGVVMAQMPDALTALYVGRAVLGALTAGLLALAVLASWSRRAGPVSLIGPALALSPMVLFLGTTLGANGVEIAGALALFAVVLRSAREDAPRWLWPAGFASAAATVLARPTGLLWLALAVGLGLVLHGIRPSVAAVRRGRGLGWGLATLVVTVPALLWDRLIQPHPSLDLALVRRSVAELPEDIRRIASEWVGVFGWASVKMTPWATRLWFLLILLLLIAAVALGRNLREKMLAPAAVVAALLLVAALDLFIFRQTRFPVYGRYTLPLGALVPLVAGHVVAVRADALPALARRLAPLVGLPLVALVHLIGLWTSARRAAVSIDGPIWFFGESQFTPPGGWEPWFAFAVVGTIALAASGLLRPDDRPPLDVPEPALTADRRTSTAA